MHFTPCANSIDSQWTFLKRSSITRKWRWRKRWRKTLTWVSITFNFTSRASQARSLLYKWSSSSGLQCPMFDKKCKTKSPNPRDSLSAAHTLSPSFLDQTTFSALSFMGLIDQGRSSFCGSQHVMGLFSRAWNQHEQSSWVITCLP